MDTDELDRALEPLRRDRPARWPDGPAVRHRVAVRRRRRVAAAALVTVGAVVAGVALGGGSSSDRTRIDQRHAFGAVQLAAHETPAPADSEAAGAVARSEQAFGLDLLRKVGGRTDDNVVVSPASLALALAMAETGANGQTRAEIARVLHNAALSPDQQDAGWSALSSELAAASQQNRIALHSANSLWLQQGFPVRPEFLAAMSRYFRSGVWRVDFGGHNQDAVNAINAWTGQQTQGRIRKLFDQLDPATHAVLANAVYFKAAWADKFDPHETQQATFFSGAGRQITVPFMAGAAGPAAITNDYSAAELPYTGRRFVADIIMPRTGSLAQFVAGLTPSRLTGITAALRENIDFTLPKFTLKTTNDLTQTLPAMGMPTAFSDTADFSAMTPRPLVIGAAVQRDYLRVSESGTEAAAVTGLAFTDAGSAATSRITFDHPFLFLIRDRVTGTILFAAQVQHP